jgi:hypothetical protein
MHALAIAKRRAQSRCTQGGAAMFVVAMTLAVLASVGIYALAAAASEVRTSGNERQNTQSHYLAEYGVIGAAHEITAGKAQWYLGIMLTQRDTPCVALPNVPSTADPSTLACRRLGSAEIGKAWGTVPVTVKYTGTRPLSSSVDPGSLGPTLMNGDFFVELTDPSQANSPARYAIGLNFCFIGMTVTAGGITQPSFFGVTDPTATFASEGIEMQRARFIVGPIQCPK